MDVDVSSRPGSSGGEVPNSGGKIQLGESEGGGGYCKPGEDCEDCA